MAQIFLSPIAGFSHNFPYGGIAVFQGFLGGIDFSLGYLENPGAAFGMLRNYPSALLILRSALVGILVFWFFFKDQENHNPIAWVMILSGALGNLVDMITHKAVIDFLNFHFYGYAFPLFNLADSFITIGAVLLIFSEIKSQLKAKKS